jgi:hypothetical protein
MHRFRALLTSALVLGSAQVVAQVVGPTPPTASAAGVTLTEWGPSPIVANLGGDPVVNRGQSLFSSAAVADVTGDGKPEIVVGSLGGVARVFSLAGALVATFDPGSADPASGRGAIQASPTIGDLDGDGINDVVIANLAGRVAAYSLAGGAQRELYNHLAPQAFPNSGNGLFATPAMGYIDRDERLDVVTASWGQTLDGWSGPTGRHIGYLRQWVKDTIWSSPAIGDVDGDGANEIVVGGDCEGLGSTGLQPCAGIGQGGYVWAFNLDGSLQWNYFVRDAVVWSSPALIDINHDGGLDVVVGTGIYFDRPGARRVLAIDGRSGQLLWQAATPGRVMGSPSVAMVNGQAWVWVVTEGGSLLAWNSVGQLQWQACIADQPCNSTLGTFGGVAIADVNNDGRLDAVVQGEQQLRVLDALTGALQTAVRSKHSRPLFAAYATPTVVTVDGKTLIVQVGLSDANGNIGIDAGDDIVVTMWSTGTSLGQAPWPTFKQNFFRTSGPLPSRAVMPPLPTTPSDRLCFGVSGSPGDAAVANLTPVLADNNGYGLLVSSDVAAPVASNVNYAPGSIDPNVAVAPIGRDGKVCYVNSPLAYVHLVADHLGTIRASAYVPAAPGGAPARKVDTRVGVGGGRVAPGGRLCFAVSGAPGDAAVVNLTPVEADNGGYGLLVSSDVPAPLASNVNYAPGTIDPNVAVAPIGSDGKVCYVNSPLASVHLVADHLGTIRSSAYVPAVQSGAPDRKVDTRIAVGGGRVPPAGRLCFPVSGSPGDAAVVNLTPVEADNSGFGLLVSSDVVAPVASNVNYAPGTVDPNVAVAPIGRDGQVCYVNSSPASVNLVADHLGTIRANAYVPAVQSGAPDRKVDTRLH